MRTVLALLLSVIFSIIFALFITTFIGERAKVSGPSMKPFLKDHDQIIIDKLSYRFRDPKRFEIVAFPIRHGKKRQYYLKRIIALPGETVQIKNGFIYLNGQKLEESYGLTPIQRSGLAKQKKTLKKNEYFLLGDNRADSLDSRDEAVGTVLKEKMIGRLWIKIK